MPKAKKEVKPVKKADNKKAKLDYQLEISVNDTVFKAEAISLADALRSFVNSSSFPLGAKTQALVKYNDGKVYRQKVWHTPEARRVFRVIALKPEALEVLASKLTEDLR